MTTTSDRMKRDNNELLALLVSLAHDGMAKKGITQHEIAEKVGVSAEHLNSVLALRTGGSLALWDRILRAIRDGDLF